MVAELGPIYRDRGRVVADRSVAPELVTPTSRPRPRWPRSTPFSSTESQAYEAAQHTGQHWRSEPHATGAGPRAFRARAGRDRGADGVLRPVIEHRPQRALLVAASLRVWRQERGLYRPLAGTSVVVAVVCLVLGAAHPAPLVLVTALVLLLGVPWGLAVVYHLSRDEESNAAQEG